MKLLIIGLLVSVTLLTGCSHKQQEVKDNTTKETPTITSGPKTIGTMRLEVVTIPDKISNTFVQKLNKQVFLAHPSKKTKGKSPLVISLHGAGQSDMVDFSFITKEKNLQILSSPKYSKYNAKVLIPQSGASWDPNSLNKMLDHILSSNSDIDVNRIYCIGFSRGGKGIWNWAKHSPHRFAAIIPRAFIPDLSNLKVMVDLPIWAMVGSEDKKERAEGVPNMEVALKALGSKVVKTTVIEGGKHGSVVGEMKKLDGVWEWLFSHSLSK